jgi:4'-phosphopantetheinyl transferase
MAQASTNDVQLPPDEIHLWFTFTDEIRETSLLERHRALLSDDERRHEERFRVPDDRRRYVITRALVRTTLSRYAPMAPEAWAFATNEHGRPRIANAEALAGGLDFNVSHTRTVVVVGVTRGRTLGVDVEDHDRTVSPGVAERFFTPDEVAAIHALPAERRGERLLEHWTLKKAYIKARSVGLAIPVRKVGFDLGREGRIGFVTAPEVDGEPGRWGFWQLRVAGRHVVGVCVEDVPGLRLVVRRTVPLESEKTIEWVLERTSA